jgi:hypothetical protein
MSIPAETLAGSAPAAIESDLLPTDDHYRLTGELATPAEESPTSDRELERQEQEIAEEYRHPPKPDESAPSKENERETAAESRPAPPQKKTESRSERRFREITLENRQLRERLDAIERRTSPQSAAETRERPDSQPAAAKTEAANTRPEPKIGDIDPSTQKPRYTTMEEYLADLRKWDREQWLAEVDSRLSKREQEKSQAAEQKAQQENERVLAEGMNKRFEATRKKYQDFDEVALNPDMHIPRGSVADVFLLQSEHAGEVAYHLGQHPEILESFYSNHDPQTGKFTNAKTPMQQHRELIDIERLFANPPAPAPKPSAKRVTNAPPPPHEVGGKNTTSLDEVEKAVEDGDMAAYSAAANARDRAKFSGRRKK